VARAGRLGLRLNPDPQLQLAQARPDRAGEPDDRPRPFRATPDTARLGDGGQSSLSCCRRAGSPAPGTYIAASRNLSSARELSFSRTFASHCHLRRWQQPRHWRHGCRLAVLQRAGIELRRLPVHRTNASSSRYPIRSRKAATPPAQDGPRVDDGVVSEKQWP